MPGMDIKGFLQDKSKTELEQILAEVGSLLRQQEEEEERRILEEIDVLAAKIGKKAILKERTAAGKKAKSKNYPPTTRPPKYRNPADPKETWHGRGPRPEWLIDLEDAGRKREEFLIGA